MRTLFDNYPSTSSVYPFVVDLPAPRWRAPFLAGLPHLWFGFFIAVERLDGEILTSLPARTLFSASQVLAVILLVTSLVVGVYAQRQDHPFWTQSWSSYSLVLAAGLVGLLVASLEIDFPIEQMGIFFLRLCCSCCSAMPSCFAQPHCAPCSGCCCSSRSAPCFCWMRSPIRWPPASSCCPVVWQPLWRRLR